MEAHHHKKIKSDRANSNFTPEARHVVWPQYGFAAQSHFYHPTHILKMRVSSIQFLQTSRNLIVGTVLLAGLFACGGGDDSPTSSSIDPYGVYQKISYGMSYETVRDMVGEDYNKGRFDGNGWVKYSWKFGTNNNSQTVIEINVRQEGVTSKRISGPRGNFTFYWI